MSASRRARVFERLDDAVLIVFAAPVTYRNNDVEHDYRQDSDFFYLTGFHEPDASVVLRKVGGETSTTLFLRPLDPEKERWDGPRLGVERAVTQLGVDEAFPMGELSQQLPKLLEGARKIHHALGKQSTQDTEVLNALKAVKRRARLGSTAPHAIEGLDSTLHECRLRKTEDDLEPMRRAATISSEAHVLAMAKAQPGMFEYEVEAELLAHFRRCGSDRVAYGSIVGSGENATVLHYRGNNRQMQAGELLLIDAGCEFGHHASDITRTFPVSGTFTGEQRALYEIVLEAQKQSIQATKPGATAEVIHDTSVRVITQGLLDLGLLTGTLDQALEQKTYRNFYMHRTGHWIGMDVHDVGDYTVDGAPRPLEPGFVLTVEPGIYVTEQVNVDARWKGIGIRIEDDILVTPTGFENLTAATPKEITDIEAACRG